MDDDGRYNRPEFLNYYFGEIDLVRGPPDASCFADELFIETRNPEDQHVFTYKYVVATPGGLQQTIDKEHLPALYFDGQVVVVSRWELKIILNRVMQEIIQSHQEWRSVNSGEHALPESNGTT